MVNLSDSLSGIPQWYYDQNVHPLGEFTFVGPGFPEQYKQMAWPWDRCYGGPQKLDVWGRANYTIAMGELQSGSVYQLCMRLDGYGFNFVDNAGNRSSTDYVYFYESFTFN